MKRNYTIEDLELILDSIPYQIWLKDEQGKHIYINKLGAEKLNLKKEDIINKTDNEIRSKEIAEKCKKTDQIVLEKTDYVCTEEYVNINGKDVWYRIDKFKVNRSNNEGYIIGGIAEEISFEKNMQLQVENNLLKYSDKYSFEENDFLKSIIKGLQKILKCKHVEIFKYDDISKKFSLYFSLNKEENIFKDNLEIEINEDIERNILFSKFYDDRYSDIYNMLIKEQKTDYNLKVSHVKLGDKIFGLVCMFYEKDELYASIDYSILDEVLSKIAIMIKQIENKTEVLAIKKEKRELENIIELDRIKTDFFAMISHEFRTPINMILSIIQVLSLRKDKMSEKEKEYLNVLTKSTYRLLRLVNNAMEAVNVGKDLYKLDFKNYNIISIAEDITLGAVNYNKKRNIIFDTNEEEVILACDAEKIELILLNLISNAMKYSQEGTDIEIYVNADFKKSKVFISVESIGILSDEDKINIFKKGYQSDDLLYRRCEGIGVGLFLAKKLVEMHGGEMYADYLDGNTKFEFYIPIKITDGEYIYDRNLTEDYIKSKCNIEFSDIYE